MLVPLCSMIERTNKAPVKFFDIHRQATSRDTELTIPNDEKSEAKCRMPCCEIQYISLVHIDYPTWKKRMQID